MYTYYRNCTHELLAVQRALRVALCTQGSAEGDEGDATHPLPPGLGSRRADACLLMGHLVELGVPGWVEAKAAMNPPPRPLIEVAELPLGRESDRSSRQAYFIVVLNAVVRGMRTCRARVSSRDLWCTLSFALVIERCLYLGRNNGRSGK